MNLDTELAEIGRLISSASFLAAVRREVSKVKAGEFVVTDGKRSGNEHEVLVRSEDMDRVARRIRKAMPEVDIERIADNLIGVNESRRTRNG